MTGFDPGLGGYAMIVAAAMLACEPWRWLAVLLSQRLNPDDELFHWVRAVSTALMAGLVARMVLFPTGSLAAVVLSVRIAAFLIGLAIFFLTGRRQMPAILGGTMVLMGWSAVFG